MEIVVLRHGEKAGDDLTPAGQQACKDLAERVGTFDIAVASHRNRTIQTAELVTGLQVRVDDRASVPDFPDDELAKLQATQETHPLGIIGAIWQNESLINDARNAGERLLGLVRELFDTLPQNGRALIVSHDGTMIGLEKLLKRESFDQVDHSFGPLQGFSIDEDLNVVPYS